MNLITFLRKSALFRVPVSFLTIFLLILPPSLIPAQSPDWWELQGVMKQGNVPKDDFAAINQGQLKNLATAAANEMEMNFLGGSGAIIRSLVKSWKTPSGKTDDYAVVTIGQLKSLAAPFYDRLISVGLANGYPWETSTKAADDFAIANIGQAKHLFSFSVYPATNVALPPGWLKKFGLPLDTQWSANADGDWVSNGWEYLLGTDPADFYDGHPPALKIASGGGQWGVPGSVLPEPVIVTVDGNRYNAPLTVSVPSGGALLAKDAAGTGGWHSSLSLKTVAPIVISEADARVYVKLPSMPGAVSPIHVNVTTGGISSGAETWAGVLDPNILPPSGLTSVGVAPDGIEVTWVPSDSTRPTTIEASKDNGLTWFRVGVTAAGVFSAVVQGVTPGAPTTFRVATGGTVTNGGAAPVFDFGDSGSAPPSGNPASAPSAPVTTATLLGPKLLGRMVSGSSGKVGLAGFQNTAARYLKEVEIFTATDPDNDGDGGQVTTTTTIDKNTAIPTYTTLSTGHPTDYGGVFTVLNDSHAFQHGVDDDNSGEISDRVWTLSEEYTTKTLLDKVIAELPPLDSAAFSDSIPYPQAFVYLRNNELTYSLSKYQYKWQVNKDANLVVEWFEVFTPEDGSAPVVEPKSWASQGATESPPFTIDPTQKNQGRNGAYSLLTVEIESVYEKGQVWNKVPNPKRPSYYALKDPHEKAEEHYRRLYVAVEPETGKAEVVVKLPAGPPSNGSPTLLACVEDNGTIIQAFGKFDSSGKAEVKFSPTGSVDEKTYKVRLGCDKNGDNKLSDNELFSLPAGPAIFPFTIKVVTQDNLSSELKFLNARLVLAQATLAGAYLRLFLGRNTTLEGATKFPDLTLPITEQRITMIAGSPYAQSTGVTTIPSFHWPDGSKASDLMERNFSQEPKKGLHGLVFDVWKSHAPEIWQGLPAQSEERVFSYEIAPGTPVDFNYSFPFHPLKLSYGGASCKSGRVSLQMKRVGNKVVATTIRLRATIEDIYDFDFTRLNTSLSHHAAIVQIGWKDPGRKAGRVFHSEVLVDVTYFSHTTYTDMTPPVKFFNDNGVIENGTVKTPPSGGGSSGGGS